MVRLTIHLENSGGAVFFAGQSLRGSIELQLDQPKKVNGLYFILYGEALASWSEQVTEHVGHGDQRRSETKTVWYEGKDVYLNTRTYLFGRQGGSATDMPSGTHRYNFECFLPQNVPASFEGSTGHIRYHIEACLDIPWRFDKETKVQFTVVRHDDLNDYPDVKMPCKHEEIVKFCCLFCQSDPMIMTATIPCSGFVPGQNIPVTVSYDNKSNVKVDRTKINLKRTIRFNSYTPQRKTKTEVDKMVEVHEAGVESGNSNSFTVNLQVPQISMNSNGRFCNVVVISYELKVEAEISGCHQNEEMIFYITIGSVPLNFNQQQAPYFNQQAPAFTKGDTQAFPNAPFYPTAPPITIPELPPPSFEEAMKMANEKKKFTNFSQPFTIGWTVIQSEK